MKDSLIVLGFFVVMFSDILQVFHSVCFLRHSAVICVSRFQAAHSKFAAYFI